jgi:hypothetical protein
MMMMMMIVVVVFEDADYHDDDHDHDRRFLRLFTATMRPLMRLLIGQACESNAISLAAFAMSVEQGTPLILSSSSRTTASGQQGIPRCVCVCVCVRACVRARVRVRVRVRVCSPRLPLYLSWGDILGRARLGQYLAIADNSFLSLSPCALSFL